MIREDDSRLVIQTYKTSYEPFIKESILRINHAKSDDNGFFECRIVNDHVTKSLQFETRVIPSKIFDLNFRLEYFN